MLTRAHYGKLIRILGAWTVLAMILACNMDGLEESSPDPAVAPSAWAEPAAEVPAAEPAPAAGGGACSRVGDCCRAYIGEMGGTVPTSTCDAYNNVVGMQDSLCEQTIAGYRSGLQAMSKTVPSACN